MIMKKDTYKNQTITQAAIKAAGGPSVVGAACGISMSAVSQWHRVPQERVRKVAMMSGVSVYELRPDIFGPDPADENAA